MNPIRLVGRLMIGAGSLALVGLAGLRHHRRVPDREPSQYTAVLAFSVAALLVLAAVVAGSPWFGWLFAGSVACLLVAFAAVAGELRYALRGRARRGVLLPMTAADVAAISPIADIADIAAGQRPGLSVRTAITPAAVTISRRQPIAVGARGRR